MEHKFTYFIFRCAADTINPLTNEYLTTEEIGEVIMCLLYVSTENPALGLKNGLLDLSRNPDYLSRVRDTVGQHILNDGKMEKVDLNGLANSPLINSCMLETTRLNSHLFAVGRKPMENEYVQLFINLGCFISFGLPFVRPPVILPNQLPPKRFIKFW